MAVYVLNTPVLPNPGTYRLERITIEQAKELLSEGFTSAIGHEATAEVLSALLDIPIPMNRIQISMEPGDKALVFRLLTRLPEGKVLSKEELLALPWELNLLCRIS